MVRAAPVALGPFVGGLNTSGPPSAIADNELLVCENFELDLDGSLRSRPPIQKLGTEVGKAIGAVTIDFRGYVVVTGSTGTYLIRDDGVKGFTISTTKYRAVEQIGNKLYLIGTGGSNPHNIWTHVGGGSLTAWDALGSAGIATDLAVYRGRLFVADNTNHKVMYSNPLTSANATAAGSFDVEPGGELIVALKVYNDNLLIFKYGSVFVFGYTTAISDAILRKINSDVGLDNQNSLVAYENSLYLTHRSRLYELRDYNFVHVNLKVPFGPVNKDTITLSIVNNRLVTGTSRGNFVFNLLTGTWATWVAAIGTHLGKMFRVPLSSEPWFVGGTDSSEVYRLHDNSESGLLSEDFNCHAVTRTFDFDDPMHYKRLRWWGVDCTSAAGSIEGTLIPVGDNTVTQTYNLTVSNARSFVKFPKALRFKQAGFSVKFPRTTAQPRCALYGLTAIVGSKQSAVKTVTR